MSLSELEAKMSLLYMEPEDDEGNQEYKYKLVGLSDEDRENRITQMNFRLDEGNGEAIYEIGITDDGCPLGIKKAYIDESIDNLRYMSDQLNASIQIIDQSESPISLKSKSHRKRFLKYNRIDKSDPNLKTLLNEKRYVCEVMVRRNYHQCNYIDLRIAVAGSVDAGKSTTIGVLTRGIKDNGNGLARQGIFNFKHELTTGRTSSISHQIMGFDSKGNVVNDRLSKLKAVSWPEIVENSIKICTFQDMAGHKQYFKTTVRGLSGCVHDYALIMIESGDKIQPMTREHIIVCLMRKIPMIIIFTKIDIAPEHVFANNLVILNKMLKGPGVNKLPYMIKDKRDIITICHNIKSNVLTPILKISNVTGEGIDHLKMLLNCLPPRISYKNARDKPAKYTVQDIFTVSGVGTVVSGFLYRGIIKVKNTYWLGPDTTGKYKKVIVKSIHNKRVDVQLAEAGQQVCLALRNFSRDLVNKGMVVIESKQEPQNYRTIVAEIEIMGRHSTNIRVGYEPLINLSNFKQTAKIMKIEKTEHGGDIGPVLRRGDKAIVTFRFTQSPIYCEVGDSIIFREGKTRGSGVVKLIH